MADLLQTAGRIASTLDLHSPQKGFSGFRSTQSGETHFRPLLKKDLSNTVLVAGDAGQAKELAEYASRLKLPLMAIVDKRRFGDDEKPRALNVIGDVDGKHCLIVDDEVASGGTLIEAATFLKPAWRSIG